EPRSGPGYHAEVLRPEEGRDFFRFLGAHPTTALGRALARAFVTGPKEVLLDALGTGFTVALAAALMMGAVRLRRSERPAVERAAVRLGGRYRTASTSKAAFFDTAVRYHLWRAGLRSWGPDTLPPAEHEVYLDMPDDPEASAIDPMSIADRAWPMVIERVSDR